MRWKNVYHRFADGRLCTHPVRAIDPMVVLIEGGCSACPDPVRLSAKDLDEHGRSSSYTFGPQVDWFYADPEKAPAEVRSKPS